MSDFRKYLDILNETTAGATGAGAVAAVPAAGGPIQKRMEEDTDNETGAPEVIEYGNWENSALATTSKLKKTREKPAKIVKSIYGEDVQSEAKKTPASNKPVDPKDLVVSLKDVPAKKPRGHKQYDPAKEFPGVKAFQKEGVAEGRFVKAAGGVPSDRHGNPLPPKPPKSVSTMTLKQLEKNRRENPGQSPFKTQDEKVKKYLGLEEEGVVEAGHQNPHAKLAQLKAKYDAALKSPNPNMTTLRRIRDQIIKLEFDLGLKEGIAEGSLEESDLILNPSGMSKLTRGFVPHDHDRTDHEVEMAKSDIYQAGKNAAQIFDMIRNISEQEGLEGWVQEKIIKASDYLNTVREYLEGKYTAESMDGVGPSTKMFTSEEKEGLWANIHAKRERIKHGSGERMRKPGSKGAPTAQAFKDSAKTSKK